MSSQPTREAQKINPSQLYVGDLAAREEQSLVLAVSSWRSHGVVVYTSTCVANLEGHDAL